MEPAEVAKQLVVAYGVIGALLIALAGASMVLMWRFLSGKIERAATASIERHLELHRQQLELAADAARLDLQRRFSDFELFNRARHSAYVRVYRRLLQAEGALAGLYGLTIATSFEEASKQQVADVMRTHELPGKMQEEILDLWERDNRKAQRLLSEGLDQWKRNAAFRRFQRFKNEWIMSELYLSPRVNAALTAASGLLAKLAASVHGPRETSMRPFEVKEQLRATVDGVRLAMQSDLGRGDYDVSIETPRLTLNTAE